MKVGINGFGRIGRDVARILLEGKHPELELVHINASGNLDDLAHLFKYDSIYGKLPHEIEATENGFVIDGKSINFTQERDPEKIDWSKDGVEIVIDATGAFKDMEGLGKHLRGTVKKVILTAPGKKLDNTIVMGVNDNTYDKDKDNILSSASCTTNCLAPLTKVILDNFGIERGLMTTIHAYTNDQNIHDSVHKKDLRRARAAAENIVPTTTGAAKAVGQVIPEVDGILTGMAVRVPVPTGSLVDVTYEVSKDVTKEEINEAVKKASENQLKGILEYTEDEIVSSDIIQNEYSCIFDSKLTLVKDRLVKCIAWYDNEWGYTQRVIDLTKLVAENL